MQNFDNIFGRGRGGERGGSGGSRGGRGGGGGGGGRGRGFGGQPGDTGEMLDAGFYYLMRKDVPVCEFSLMVSSNSGYRYSIEVLNVADKKKMPVEARDNSNISYFLMDRLSPIMRGQLGRSITVNGEPLGGSLKTVIEYTAGTSLIDDFWLKRTDDTEKTWSSVNLFENDLDTTVASIAFTGNGRYETNGFIHSPDFTTDGMMDKAWRRIDSKTLLYKAGAGRRSQGGVFYSEFYAAQVAERLGLNHVGYGLDVWYDRLCSTCELFTSPKHAYINGRKALSGDINSFVNSLDRDSRMYQEIADIILFDGITGNGRHLGNLGFIQDNDIAEIVGLAPIFDNGAALFNNVPDNGLKSQAYTSTYYRLSNRMYAQTTLEDIKSQLTQRQRDLAKKMDGFQFTRHPTHNLSEGRLKDLEAVVKRRAKELSQ